MDTIEGAANSDDLFSRQRPELIPAAEQVNSSADYCKGKLRHLILTLTENCNLRCTYCLHGASLPWVRGHGSGSMSREIALRATRYFLENCSEDNTPAVSFYGGEALLEAGLVEAVVREVRSHPRGKEAYLVVDTNGVLLDETITQLIVIEKLHLQISLDGPKNYHDRQRLDTRGRGTYTRIMKGLDRLLELDPTVCQRLSFICTVTPPADLMKLDDFFSNLPFLTRRGIKEPPNLRVNLANLRGQNWPATEDDFQDLYEQLGKLREFYFQEVSAGRRGNLGPVVRALVEPGLFQLHHRKKGPIGDTFTPGGNCRPGLRKLHVTVDGRLQLCERTGDQLNLGTVDSGIETAAVVSLQQNFFESVRENCADCWALRQCQVCYAGWAEYCNISKGEKLPVSVCDTVRSQVENEMKLLVRILQLPAQHRQFLDDVILD